MVREKILFYKLFWRVIVKEDELKYADFEGRTWHFYN